MYASRRLLQEIPDGMSNPGFTLHRTESFVGRDENFLLSWLNVKNAMGARRGKSVKREGEDKTVCTS